MERPLFLEEIDDNGVAHIALTRADKHNAFNAQLIGELTTALQGFASDDRVRCLLLTGEGNSFSAGADLDWMRAMSRAGEAENREDARALGRLLETLDSFPQPTMALVHGAAIGGGLGLVACCDIAVASDGAVFALPEVRLGLTPATIHPYVMAAIGYRAARRYSLTGERFDAKEAHRLGLVHEVVGWGSLQSRGREIVESLLKGGPEAQVDAKEQLRGLYNNALDDDLREDAAKRIATRRASAEGQEGIAAFMEKRQPDWTR